MSVGKTPRTLVLCFDGTSSEYSTENTNAIRLFSTFLKTDIDEQLCYYQAGIGTFFSPGLVSPMYEWFAKQLDVAIAWYLDTHVMDGYKFLMQNYRAGDRICLFGFSRGAYTARALAGMLHKVGLLQKDNDEQVTFAYKLYKQQDDEGINLSAGFKQTFCQDVSIDFIGVWDTVSSVGVVMGKTLPFTNSNESIKTFRQALSLDEHRARFRPSTFRVTTEASGDTSSARESSSKAPLRSEKRSSGRKWFKTRSRKSSETSTDVEQGTTQPAPEDPQNSSPPAKVTDAKEVWFVGCHADVGGGAVPNDTKHSLANITLRWMVREVMVSQCGIRFDSVALSRLNIPPAPSTIQKLLSSPPKETELDKADALEPIHDEMKKNVLWWILEVIPLHYEWQDDTGKWHSTFGWNLGRGREIDDIKPAFHTTVKQRMQDSKYTPKAKWKKGTEVFVE